MVVSIELLRGENCFSARIKVKAFLADGDWLT